ncbi:MAG: acetylornithine deacetylase [Propioniciclava sp.]
MPDPSPDVRSWLEQLVAFDTTSSQTNLPLVNAVAEHLAALGLEPLILPAPDGSKANLVVTVPDVAGNLRGGVMLSGHTDVVPTEGQPWTSHPYTLTERDRRWYGRGTTDMKGFNAVMLAAVPSMMAGRLREPIHLAFSYDEEVGCLGAVPLVEALREADRLPAMCFVGEPTSMRMIRGHKSISVITVTVTGRAAHSSLTDAGVNAIEHAGAIVGYWEHRAAQWRNQGPFDPDYPIAHTTGAVTTITGGNGVNIIPASCRLTLEFRTIGATDVATEIDALRGHCARVQEAMRTEAGADPEEVGVEVVVDAQTPGLETPVDGLVVERGVALGLTVSDEKVTYGTEAGIFAAAGISTVVCGPGDIARAHTADEYIEPAELAHCEQIIGRLVESARV